MVHVIKTTIEQGKKTIRLMSINDKAWEAIVSGKFKQDNVSWELQKESLMADAVNLTPAKDSIKKVSTKDAVHKEEVPKKEVPKKKSKKK